MSIGCCVCGSRAAEVEDTRALQLYVRCGCCGSYLVDTRACQWFQRVTEDFIRLRPYLSAHLRQASERGEAPVAVNLANWRSMADRHAHTSVARKLEMLLETLARQTKSPGTMVPVVSDDYALIDAADAAELDYLLEDLVERDLIRSGNMRQYAVTPKGWELVTPRVQPGGEPGTCFVAMAFDESLKEIYDVAIEPVIRACGLRAIRVDRLEHNGFVNDVIFGEIRRAQVVIADVTLQRPGVYFEAGFAIGLGRPVIWSCRQDEIGQVHFDTRQYAHVVWTDGADLRARLEARIRGTVSIPVSP